jgi:hypothetical protein
MCPLNSMPDFGLKAICHKAKYFRDINVCGLSEMVTFTGN